MVSALPEDHPAAEARDQVRATAQLTSLSVLAQVGVQGWGQFMPLAVLSVLTHSSSVHQE